MSETTTKRKKFTVDRKTWCRGGYNGTSMLRNDQGNKCCLGFVCEQSGVDPADLARVCYPMALVSRQPEIRKKIDFLLKFPRSGLLAGVCNSPLSREAALINDRICLTEIHRETELIELFNKDGFDLEFIN